MKGYVTVSVPVNTEIEADIDIASIADDLIATGWHHHSECAKGFRELTGTGFIAEHSIMNSDLLDWARS